jgi:DNA-binding response OmpR family regulator
MKLLVIEDSGACRDLLVRTLRSEQVEVESAARFSTGLRQALSSAHDVIVLDLMLPDGSGLDLCRRLRAEGILTPILCLTARGNVADRVEGLEAGADDYLQKPFALAELRARIRALARRRGLLPLARIEVGPMRVDFTARRLLRDGREVPLTAREWAVLEVLAARRGRVVAKAELLESVWHGVGRHESESLDVILSRLRRKLTDDAAGCALRTVRGEGYMLEDKE